MNKILTAALLASAGVALLSQGARAQTVTYTHQDLLLGFRETGKTTDLLLDLGSASQYYSPSSTATFSVTGLSLTDINFVFGNFNSVNWGIYGTVRLGDVGGKLNNTLWTTTTRPDLNTPSSPLTQASSGSQQNVGAKITSIGSNFTGSPATPNSTKATYQTVGSGTDFGTFLGSGGNFGGTYLAANGSVESSTPSSFSTGPTQYVYEDLYELDPSASGGSGTLLGFFTLGSDASLTFSPVPEPSTMTLIGGAGLGLLILGLRRRITNA